MTETTSVLGAVAPGGGQSLGKNSSAQLRYRKSVTLPTAAEVTALRSAISAMLRLGDDRGFEYWAGIHGLPLPISCTHGTLLFLPWHRAYLYYFEQYLLDAMPPGITVGLLDRLWALWQQAHHGAGAGSVPASYPLGPFPTINVGQTLSVTELGYQYAAATSSATPAPNAGGH